MRIRKRPRPAAVEQVARAAPAFENKPENAPKSLHAEVQITHRSERLDGGSLEPPAVVVCEKNEVFQNGKTTTTTEEEEAEADGGGTTDLLMKSLLVVFERAGTRGLTAREAVAKLVEYELPGLQEGERSSVQVAKVLRTPDFVHLVDGKYFIFPSTPHAVVAESSTQSEPSQQPVLQPRLDINLNLTVPNLNHRRKRAPVKTTTSTSTVAAASYSETSELSDKVPEEKIELKKRRRRPPSSQHELAIGPRQCKRYDGRGWQCTRETEEGFSFCEHHQALMNKRTLRLNLAKKRRATNPTEVDVEQQGKAAAGAATTTTLENGGGGGGSSAATTTTTCHNNINMNKEQLTVVAPYGIEDLIHNQRRRLVKARSLKSIK